MAIFPGEPGSAGSSLDPPPPAVPENLRGLMKWGFSWAGCPTWPKCEQTQ